MLFKTFSWAGFCIIVGFGLFATSSPAAATNVAALEPIGDWKATKWSDKCRLSRSFSGKRGTVRLTLEKGGTEPTFNLILVGDYVKNPKGGIISLQFGPDEKPFGRNYIKGETRKGDGFIAMYGASFSSAVPNENDGYTIERLEPKRLASIEYVQIERAGLRPFRLLTGDLTESMAIIARCTQSLEGALAVSESGESKAAEPASDASRWLLSEDYPPMMLSYRQEGVVSYRLTVSKDGHPTFCNIEESTTPQMFDDAVCLALLKRAKFKPALDWNGEPKTSYWYGSVRFQIN